MIRNGVFDLIELAYKAIVAVHPHWRSELQLSIFGGIVRHALYDIIGTYIESGKILFVDWPNHGKEEFIKLKDYYYHISILNNLEVQNEKLYLKTENEINQIACQKDLQEKAENAESVLNDNPEHDYVRKIKSSYNDLMKSLIYDGVSKINTHVVERKGDRSFPLVSVIVPTKNRSALLREAVSSISYQSYSNIEVIIVDDNSVDQTRQVAEEFVCKCNVKYIRSACNKSTAARNIGLRHATGEYIAYLDDDNLWFPTFISSAISYFEHNKNIDFIYGVLVLDDNPENEDLYIFQQYNENKLRMYNYIDTNVIVHRSTLLKVKDPWDENLNRLGDWDFVLSHTSRDNTAAISVLAAYYRTHAEHRNTIIYSLEENARYIKNKHKIV